MEITIWLLISVIERMITLTLETVWSVRDTQIIIPQL